jgi:hypothetical protein
VRNALAKADEAVKTKIESEVFELMNKNFPDGHITLDSAALIIYGEK